MELADVVDSKSTAGDSVPVRLRPAAPFIRTLTFVKVHFLCVAVRFWNNVTRFLNRYSVAFAPYKSGNLHQERAVETLLFFYFVFLSGTFVSLMLHKTVPCDTPLCSRYSVAFAPYKSYD